MAKAKSKAKSGSQPSKGDSYKKIRDLSQLMDEHGIQELEWDSRGELIRVRKGGGFAPGASAILPSPSDRAAALPPQKEIAKPNQKSVVSPFVGTFYRAASPSAAPYVKEGQSVRRGEVLCIVEAMKLMNEIESEHSGKIAAILVENGQPVEFGEPLFLIET